MKNIAVYPGSFDPCTNGHLDIIERASSIFDEVIVAILINSKKTPVFSIDERKMMLETATAGLSNVRVDFFDGLLVNYMKKVSAKVVVRGLRATSDFEYEFQMALMNKKLYCDIETVFMTTSSENFFLSSSVIKEIAGYGGKIDGLVPPSVKDFIINKIIAQEGDYGCTRID